MFAELAAVDRNPARQLKHVAARGRIVERRESSVVVRIGADREIMFSRRRNDGEGTLLAPRDAYEACLASGELAGTWLHVPPADSAPDVVRTYKDAFTYNASRTPGEPGLRPPQVGAVHAAVAHWIAEAEAPATIVMPTGTGKTDTMIALLVAASVDRLLVVVPSDTLRDQTAQKFETLGILRSVGAVTEAAANPVVGRVRHKFQSADRAVAFAVACNVVVTTPNALRGSSADVRAAFLAQFDRLVVDEAHHVAASSWKAIRDEFGDRGALQFTATPFREDGRALGGRQIFTFPLSKAQAGGYFSRIQYRAVLVSGSRSRDCFDRCGSASARPRCRS